MEELLKAVIGSVLLFLLWVYRVKYTDSSNDDKDEEKLKKRVSELEKEVEKK